MRGINTSQTFSKENPYDSCASHAQEIWKLDHNAANIDERNCIDFKDKFRRKDDYVRRSN